MEWRKDRGRWCQFYPVRIWWCSRALSRAPKRLWAGLGGVGRSDFLGGDLPRRRRRFLVHHGTASGAQIGPVLLHAGSDGRNVGDLGAAQPERITGAHLLLLDGVGKARGRRQRGDRGGESQHESGLANGPGDECSHGRLLLAWPGGPFLMPIPCSQPPALTVMALTRKK